MSECLEGKYGQYSMFLMFMLAQCILCHIFQKQGRERVSLKKHGLRKFKQSVTYTSSINRYLKWPPPYTTPFPIKMTFKVHLHGVATGNFVSLFPMVTILCPIIWCTLLPMMSKVDKLPLDTESAACNNNPSRKWKPCHQTFIVSYLNVMLCESYMQSNLVIFSLLTDSVRPWPWIESVWRKRKAFTFIECATA